ncbi:MAG: hypothetical protein WDN46_12945 [Methylocella sp.]
MSGKTNNEIEVFILIVLFFLIVFALDKRDKRSSLFSYNRHDVNENKSKTGNDVNSDPKWEIEDNDKWTKQNLIALWGLILASGALFFSFLGYLGLQNTLKETRRQADLASNQLKLTFPAKLKLTNIEIYNGTRENNTTHFVPGQNFNLDAYFVNVGRQSLVTKYEICLAYWTAADLPSVRPWTVGNHPCDDPVSYEKPHWYLGEGAPGSVLLIRYNVQVPKNYTRDMSFYFMGAITYKDDVSDNLFVTFARRFDVSKGRFISIDDPNYEISYPED